MAFIGCEIRNENPMGILVIFHFYGRKGAIVLDWDDVTIIGKN